MRIQHNITALNAHRQLGINNTSVGKNLEKLSSGFRINRAGDDAAGLAISEKMRGQIRGLDMASNNAQDGISLIQTAEGNLQETHSILQRMRELAVQSSNGTFETVNDRENLDKEVQALKDEVNRIASSAHFNNTKLLNGNLEKTVVTPAGTSAVASEITTTGVVNQKGSDAVASKYTVDMAGHTTGANTTTVDIFGVGVAVATNAVAGTSLKAATAANATTTQELADILNANTTANVGFTYATDGGTKIIATAKTAGATSIATNTTMTTTVANSAGGVAPTTATPVQSVTGTNAGAGSAAKGAEYKFTFDLDLIAGGQTFTLGEGANKKTIELSTSGIKSTGVDEIVNMSAFDLTTTAGKATAAAAFKTAINTVFSAGGAFTVGTESAVDADNKFSVEMVAAAGTGGNWGAIREDVGASGVAGFLDGTQTVRGAAAGIAKPTVFATAELKIDFAALKAGDKITLDGKTFEAIAATGTVDPSKNQFKLDASEATSASNFISALESHVNPTTGAPAGFTAGKASYSVANKTMTIESTNATQNSTAFIASLSGGKDVTFAPISGAPTSAVMGGGVVFQIGANGTADDRVSLTIEKQDTTTLGIGAIDIKSILSANTAIDAITIATNKVSATRADLGALQNRLEHTVANLGTTSENLTAAESRIRDVDMAKEMMEMTKNNILSQAAQAMLAQANQQPQGILQLLR